MCLASSKQISNIVQQSTCKFPLYLLTLSLIKLAMIYWRSLFITEKITKHIMIFQLLPNMMTYIVICSSILDVTEVRDSGLLLLAKDLFPFFKIGTTLALIQSFGNWPWSNDCWKNEARMGANSCDSSLRIYVGTPCGPLALFTVRDSRSFWTPNDVTIIWLKFGHDRLGSKLGKELSFSLMKNRMEINNH